MLSQSATHVARAGSYELEFEAIFRKLEGKQARVDVRAVLGGRVTPVIYKNVVGLNAHQESVLNDATDEYSTRVMITHFNLRTMRKMLDSNIPGDGHAFVKHWGKAVSFRVGDLSQVGMDCSGDLDVQHVQLMKVAVKSGSDMEWLNKAVDSVSQETTTPVEEEEPVSSVRGDKRKKLGEVTIDILREYVGPAGVALTVSVEDKNQNLWLLGEWQVDIKDDYRTRDGDVGEGVMEMLMLGAVSSMVRQSATGVSLANYKNIIDDGAIWYHADVMIDPMEHPTAVAYAISKGMDGCHDIVPVEL